MLSPKVLVAFISVIMAFCSMTYQFSIAQVLTSLYGGTVFRYSLSTGIYIASLGIGGFLFFIPEVKRRAGRSFLLVELTLSMMGFIGPLVVLGFEAMFDSGDLVAYFWLSLLGLLSGLEIPLLMQLASKFIQRPLGLVLGSDYLGTCLACLVFPLIFLPEFGILYTSIFLGFINGLIVVGYLHYSGSRAWKLSAVGCVLSICLAFVYLPVYVERLTLEIF
tara:strand:+ start:34 stop:693 length:660 start_codon:yes stop_codon:yes gene_type:complete